MKLKIMSWNVRGANDATERKPIKAFLRTQCADVVCILETKWKDCSKGVVRSLATSRFIDWAASGGMVILWDKRVVQLIGLEESSYTLSCRFRNCEDNFIWVSIGQLRGTLGKSFGRT